MGFKCTIKVESNFGTCRTPGNQKCIHLIFEITFEIGHETDWFCLLWASILRLRVVDCNIIFKGKKLVNCFRKIISGWWSETEETNAEFITNNLLTLWQNINYAWPICSQEVSWKWDWELILSRCSLVYLRYIFKVFNISANLSGAVNWSNRSKFLTPCGLTHLPVVQMALIQYFCAARNNLSGVSFWK